MERVAGSPRRRPADLCRPLGARLYRKPMPAPRLHRISPDSNGAFAVDVVAATTRSVSMRADARSHARTTKPLCAFHPRTHDRESRGTHDSGHRDLLAGWRDASIPTGNVMLAISTVVGRPGGAVPAIARVLTLELIVGMQQLSILAQRLGERHLAVHDRRPELHDPDPGGGPTLQLVFRCCQTTATLRCGTTTARFLPSWASCCPPRADTCVPLPELVSFLRFRLEAKDVVEAGPEFREAAAATTAKQELECCLDRLHRTTSALRRLMEDWILTGTDPSFPVDAFQGAQASGVLKSSMRVLGVHERETQRGRCSRRIQREVRAERCSELYGAVLSESSDMLTRRPGAAP